MNRASIAFLPLVIGAALAPGCDDDTTTCGPGTVLQDGACVAVSSVSCGPGTVLEDGACVSEGSGGGSGTTCGEGTWELDGTCVPYDPSDTTAPTTTVDPNGGELGQGLAVTMTADEPATVYYTLDGSTPTTSSANGSSPLQIPSLLVPESGLTLSFFALDAAGNAEAVQSVDFVEDPAPGPVGALAVTANGNTAADIAWTAPTDADLAGYVVAQITDGDPSGGPSDGEVYAAGDVLPGGHVVRYVGDDTSTSQSALTPGFVQYAVWAYDVQGHYSALRTGAAELPLATQTATLTIDGPNQTITITNAENITLESNHLDVGDTWVDVRLLARNTSSRVLYNTKFVVKSLSEGIYESADGQIDGEDYTYVDTLLAPGETSSPAFLTLNNIDDAHVITLTLEIRDDPLLLGSSRWATSTTEGWAPTYDTGTGLVSGRGNDDSLPTFSGLMGPRNSSGYLPMYYGYAMSLDGTRAYFGIRQKPAIVEVNLVTGGIRTILLGDTKGFTRRPVLDHASNTLYALVTHGAHAYDGSLTEDVFPRRVEVVAIDVGTFTERSRVELAIASANDNECNGTDIAVSPDGTRVAATVRGDDVGTGSVHFVDVASWTELDIDPATAGLQTVDVSTALNPRSVVFSNDGTTAYVSKNSDGDVEVMRVDMATFATTEIDVNTRYTMLAYGPDDRLYIGNADSDVGIFTLEPGSTTPVQSNYDSDDASAMVFGGNGNLYIKGEYGSADYYELNPSTGEVLTTISDVGSRYGHSIGITPFR